MSIGCEWRLAELVGGATDNPFDRLIVSSGLNVDLAGTEEQVFEGLRESLVIESALFNEGVVCSLKDGGQDCLSCTMYVGDRPEEERSPLCRLGRDQRVIEQRCATLATERREPLLELADMALGYMELGDAETDEELLEVALI